MRLFYHFMNIDTEFTVHSGYIVSINLNNKARQNTPPLLLIFVC